jgi:hypothetical protein
LLYTGKAKPKLQIHVTDYSEQAELLAQRFLGAEFAKLEKAVVG